MRPEQGEVLEWLKRHAWKACIPLKGITSSNLVLSAVCFMKFYQIRGCVGTTHPLFLFWGQRVVEPFPTGIQITDKIPAGSHGLFPPGFLFRLSLRSGRHGLGRSCGLQSPLASAFLPHIFSVACSLPGRRATVRRFPFLHLLYDCFPAGLITISTAVRTGPFQHFPVCFPRLWSSSATASFTACGSGATLIAMRILDSISRRYSSSISSSVMYTQRKAMSAL